MKPTTHESPAQSSPNLPVTLDGFDVLDGCHRQNLLTLGKLSALVARLKSKGADKEARTMAAEIVHFFSTTVRRHHEDEERHVFPALKAGVNATMRQAIEGLEQDHVWLESDWAALARQLEAIEGGGPCPDLDVLQESVEVFADLSRAHIALEEACIYPQARMRVGSQERHAWCAKWPLAVAAKASKVCPF